jgi:hypothetical protein
VVLGPGKPITDVIQMRSRLDLERLRGYAQHGLAPGVGPEAAQAKENGPADEAASVALEPT